MENVGKIAYDAYCEQTGGKFTGSSDKLPGFPELKPEIQNAWLAAVNAVQNIDHAKHQPRA